MMTERMTYAIVNCAQIDGDSEQRHDTIRTSMGAEEEIQESLFQ